MTKAELRQVYLDKRKALSPEDHAAQSLEISQRFFSGIDLSSVRSLHCFISLKHKGEIETSAIFQRLWSEFPNITTFAPRVNADNEIDSLPFHADSRLADNKWKIPEPTTGEVVDPGILDMVIVPLLCFDNRGHRVGYGGGFYDRFLARCRPDCRKIGLSFFPPVDEIVDVYKDDIRLDRCITPLGLIDLN